MVMIVLLIGGEKIAIKSKWLRDSWINHTAESQSDWNDHQCFENGCNEEDKLILVITSSCLKKRLLRTTKFSEQKNKQ